jgi:mono/diheme cytochrome c family protein
MIPTVYRYRLAAGLTRIALVSALAAALPAQDDSADNSTLAVLNVLEAHCVQCHGGEKTKAGLDLTTSAGLQRGGESGAAVAVGRPEASLLYRMVNHDEEPGMPHKAAKLPDNEITPVSYTHLTLPTKLL